MLTPITDGHPTKSYADLVAGNDTYISSSMAADKLWGQAGDDMISTGGGSDFIDGGTGNETLTGGSEADVFFFGKNAGTDTVTDFSNLEGGRRQPRLCR